MERHEILEAMGELKLYGMRASFDEITGKGLARRDELYPLIASLLRAERTHRQARSISYRIAAAKLPVLKDLDQFVFADVFERIFDAEGARRRQLDECFLGRTTDIGLGLLAHDVDNQIVVLGVLADNHAFVDLRAIWHEERAALT